MTINANATSCQLHQRSITTTSTLLYTVCTLHQAGASLECEDRNKNRPLHLAAQHGHEAVVKLLVEVAPLISSKKH